MSAKPPVEDWATDFDHTDPRFLEDPFPIVDALRERCPIAHSKRFEDGAYYPTRYADIRDIAYDTEHFTSRRVVVREKKFNPVMPSPPITSDPPEHRTARMPLLPAFNVKAVEKIAPASRALCHRLIDAFIARGRCDAALEYGQHIPTRSIANMLGVDENDGDRYVYWIKLALEEGIHDNAKVMQSLKEMSAYFAEELKKRGDTPGDDLIRFMRDQRVDGKPLPPEVVVGTLRLLLIAGIDTTWSAIGASLWHLATHEADRRRLAAEPALMETAVEEFLRVYAPVTMAREVKKEVTVGGCTMQPGAMVFLPFMAANRDPEKFADADKVVLDRKENPHAAFGLGIHRCVGSNLARMNLRTAIEVWMERIPEFTLAPDAKVTWSEGTVRGPRALPLVFPA